MTLLELLGEDNKEIMLALIRNIRTLIERFCNEFAVSQVPDQVDKTAEDTPTKGYPGLMHSNTIGNRFTTNDFSSVHRKYELNAGGRGGFKKLPTMQLGIHPADQVEENETPESTYIIASEYKSETVYQELLPRLLQLDEHINAQIGLWRQHADFLDQFSDTFKLFHMPELQDSFVPTLFKYLQNGNNQLRVKICKCLVMILAWQYDPERRQALAKQINEELGESRAFQIRRTFVTLCQTCAGMLTKDFFLETFYANFLVMAKDRVAQVRMEFAKALLDLKPFIETDQQKDFEMMEMIDLLKNDPD